MVGLLIMNDYGDYRDELIGTPEGMGMFLVVFELSNNGEVIETTSVANIEAINLEEVFQIIEEDIVIEYQLREVVNMNYGQVDFDAWRPKLIQQFFLDKNGIVIQDKEPPVVWQDGDGEVTIN